MGNKKSQDATQLSFLIVLKHHLLGFIRHSEAKVDNPPLANEKVKMQSSLLFNCFKALIFPTFTP